MDLQRADYKFELYNHLIIPMKYLFVCITLYTSLIAEQDRRIYISPSDTTNSPSDTEYEVYTGPTRYGRDLESFNTVLDFSLGDHTTLIVDYAVGYFSNGWIHENYFICGMGWNQHGISGDGTNEDQTVTTRLVDGEMIRVSAGYFHSMFLGKNGDLWTTGFNSFGQLGNGTTSNRNTHSKVVDSGVSEISAGATHSIFLKDDGSLWTMGRNDLGQLGNGTTTNFSQPVKVVSANVKEIDAGSWHNVFIKKDGSLWGFGSSKNGELGARNKDLETSPVILEEKNTIFASAGLESTAYVKEDGSLWVMGRIGKRLSKDYENSTPNGAIKVEGSGVETVSVGAEHIVYIKEDGSMWGFGSNTQGELGLGHDLNQTKPVQIIQSGVMRVEAGHNFNSAFMLNDGSLWMMGSNAFGKLGLGQEERTLVPVQVAVASQSKVLSIDVEESDRGEIEGSGLKRVGSKTILKATAKPGYRFNSWGEDLNTTQNPMTIFVDKSMSVTANFVPDTSDTDSDGLSNYEEITVYGTDPSKEDTDDDGLTDKDEIDSSWDPKSSDKKTVDDVLRMKGSTDDKITPFVQGWFYLPSRGWMWTNRQAYPYFYDASDKDWMYFQTGNDKPKFYHYGKKLWLTLE